MRREVLKREHWVGAARALLERGGRLVALWGSERRQEYFICAAYAAPEGLLWLELPLAGGATSSARPNGRLAVEMRLPRSTTNAEMLLEQIAATPVPTADGPGMSVIFSTYHSIAAINALGRGAVLAFFFRRSRRCPIRLLHPFFRLEYCCEGRAYCSVRRETRATDL